MTPGQAATTAVSHPLPGRVTPCGAALSANARQLAQSRSFALRLYDQLVELIRSGVPVALRVRGLEGGNALQRYYLACRGLRDAFAEAGVDPQRLELTLGAGSLPLLPAWRIRRTLLGNGVLNVLFDAGLEDGATSMGQRDALWRNLWHLRSARVRSSFWPTVRSACALLSPEDAHAVVPGCGLQAPEQSAWMRAELDVTVCAGDDGRIDLEALTASVAGLMEEADRVADTACWPTAVMQHDAWYNRRLAIVPVGIGEIAKRRNLDPDCHGSLTTLRQLLSGIRQVVESRSRAGALQHERLPSIAASDPCLHLPAGARETCWQQRWHTVLEQQAIHHRNLVVLSPWSLFPRGSADFRYANFLPLLAQADACEFERSESLVSWTAAQLKLFHCRALALNDGLMSSAVVADQP